MIPGSLLVQGRTCVAFVLGALVTAQASATILVRPDFVNELRTSSNNSSNSSSAAMFSGHIGTYTTPGSVIQVVPGNSRLRLVESSFGQMLSTDNPYPDFAYASRTNALALLYPPQGASRAELETGGTNHWAFRYKWLLYSNDVGGVALVNGFPASWYGNTERQKMREALDVLRLALAYAPYDRNLRHAYLDVFYDQAIAEMQGVKSYLTEISRYRLGFVALGATEFIIDKEIQGYTNILNQLQSAITNYARIFSDFSGVDVSTLDPTASAGTPFGYFMFQQEQPFRNQMAAQFIDTDGVLKTVPDLDPQTGEPLPANSAQRVLFAGYKDFVMLMSLLKDYSQYSAELARLYGTRGIKTSTQDDVQAAYAIIARVQTEIPIELQLLTGMFPPESFPPGDASGARAAINGVQLGVAELDAVQAFLSGRSNPLGFDPNFLVLIQEAPGLPASSPSTPYDSYDSLQRWMRATPTAPLNRAESTFVDARVSYTTYRGYADQVKNELTAIDDTYQSRHVEITGFEPDDAAFDGQNARAGSELWQSQLMLTNLQTRLSNLREAAESISNQLQLATLIINNAAARTNQIDSLLRAYLQTNDVAWEEIHKSKALAAGFQAATEAVYAAASVDSVTTTATGGGNVAAIGVMGAINTIVQERAARDISEREQDLADSSAWHEAELRKLDAAPLVLQAQQDFQASIQSQLSNTRDRQEVQRQILQETAHRARLARELEQCRLTSESAAERVANRYYADPIHFIRAQAESIEADQAFRRAQRWVFYTQRALEYKWNKDFVWSYQAGRSFDRGTIFKIRNADELQELVAALEDFNLNNLINFNREPNTDLISLVDDVLLPYAGPVGTIDNGLRNDPLTGASVTKDELFRRILRGQVSSQFVTREAGFILIKLNTFALPSRLGTLFIGPRYDNNGNLTPDRGKYLDKLSWLKFNVIVSNPPGPATRLTAGLVYGGTCYIRVASPPCTYTAANPRPLFRAFPFQYFYQNPTNDTFLVATTQSDSVKMAFSSISEEPERNVPNSTLENRFLKERSVAATDLQISISEADLANYINTIRDLEIYIHHLSVTPQPCTP